MLIYGHRLRVEFIWCYRWLYFHKNIALEGTEAGKKRKKVDDGAAGEGWRAGMTEGWRRGGAWRAAGGRRRCRGGGLVRNKSKIIVVPLSVVLFNVLSN